MNPKKRLRKYVMEYRRTHQTGLSEDYVKQLLVAVSMLERCAQKRVKLKHLNDELVNTYIAWMVRRGLAPDTIRGRRNAILTLWREAFQQKILDQQPQRIKKIIAHVRSPEAWTPTEVRQLRKTAVRDQRMFRNGLTRGPWFGSLIGAGWDSGLRLGDLLRLRYDTLPDCGPFGVNQHKTKRDVTIVLSDSTRRMIDETMADGDRELIWPLWARREQFYSTFGALVSRAGIRPGTFRWLRKSAITAVEAKGGNGSKFAGHRSRQVTERHYIDQAQLPLTSPTELEAD